jgi:hypothetical protein
MAIPEHPGMNGGMARPTAVTVIGWAAIGVGCYVILGVPVFLSSVRSGSELFAHTAWLTVGEPPHSRLAPGALLAGVLGIAFGVFLVLSGHHLLRLRAWARAALEVAAWVGLVGGVAWVVAGVFRFASGLHLLPLGAREAIPVRVLVVVGLVLRGAIAVPLAAVCAIGIRALRSKAVRDATGGGGAPRRPDRNGEAAGVRGSGS